MRTSVSEASRFVAGILLAGYGLLVALRVLAHESFAVGVGLVAAGALLLWTTRRQAFGGGGEAGNGAGAAAEPRIRPGHVVATAALGMAAAGGVIAYNVLARSTLSPPEIGILLYGLGLLAAAPHLHRRLGPLPVSTAVAWSLPLLAAPLGMFALDAFLKSTQGSSPMDPFIAHALVAPMAASLALLGFDTVVTNQTVMLGTPRGSLALTIGLVCAGLHPGILFMGLLGLHAWQQETPPPRLAAYLALGLVGVYLANLIRLVFLALVGYAWGGVALQTAHAHAGWILFIAWILLFWGVVLHRLEGASSRAKPQG